MVTRTSAVALAGAALLACTSVQGFAPLQPFSRVLKRAPQEPTAADTRDPQDMVVVELSYHMFFADGSPVSDPEPLFNQGRVKFLLDQGNYIPGLHDTAREIPDGKTASVIVPPQRAYGEAVPELTATAPISAAPEGVKVGDKLQLSSGQLVRVTGIQDGKLTLDGNEPHAGKEIMMDVTMHSRRAVRDTRIEVIDLAGGCFWGMELAFQRLPGVVGTAVGYTQGVSTNPKYEEVCTGSTGHTEAVRVFYDAEELSPEDVLDVFFANHDCTQLNRQGNDEGTQYRGGIYWHDAEQEAAADLAVSRLMEQYEEGEVVTEVKKASPFYYAEDYHQQYLQKGGQTARKNAEEDIRCYG